MNQIAFKQGTTTRMTTTKSYDNLNRLVSIASSNVSPALLDWHAYGYNSANQRTSVTNTDGSFWIHQYDSLGQVVCGKRSWSDGTPVAGQQFQYGFDDTGNRNATAAGGDQWGANLRYATYSPNSLNQYTSRTVPGAVDVIGTATNTATVTVNNTPTYRKGSYYRAALPLANASAPVWQSITNLAVLNNGTNSDITTNVTGNVYLPQSPENFMHDSDGNLTQDGRWQYSWDGENRLVSLQAISGMPTAAKFKLDFVYDWQGRRIQKTISTNNGSAYYPLGTNRFIYDSWNLLVEATGLTVLRSYLWGLDLSGSLEGAGGVGGLLVVSQSASNTTQFACYDGNGNLSGLVDATTAAVTGQYEYCPFGEVTRVTGQAAKGSPLRFSTKYQDDETELIYYGYRYYRPSMGQWSSRDPIRENPVERGARSAAGRGPPSAMGRPGTRCVSCPVTASSPQGEVVGTGWREGRDPAEARGVNPYSFVSNSPLLENDPLGLCEFRSRDLGYHAPGKCGGFPAEGCTWLDSWVLLTEVEPCRSACGYNVRISQCWAGASSWWSHSAARVHEALHRYAWEVAWGEAASAARRLAGGCVSQRRAYCYQALISLYRDAYRWDGSASNWELDCALYGALYPALCTNAQRDRAEAQRLLGQAAQKEVECGAIQ